MSTSCCIMSVDAPARSSGIFSSESCSSASSFRRARRASQSENRQRMPTPPRIMKSTTEKPNGVIS